MSTNEDDEDEIIRQETIELLLKAFQKIEEDARRPSPNSNPSSSEYEEDDEGPPSPPSNPSNSAEYGEHSEGRESSNSPKFSDENSEANFSPEAVENVVSWKTNEKTNDPERKKLLAILEDEEEPEMSVEEMLEKIYDENKEKEQKNKENLLVTSVSNKETPSCLETPAPKTPILHPNVNTLIDLTDESKIVTIKVEQTEKIIIIDYEPHGNEEKETTVGKSAANGNKAVDQKLLPKSKTQPAKSDLSELQKTHVKVETIVVEDDPPVKNEMKEKDDVTEIVIKSEREEKPIPSTSQGLSRAEKNQNYEDEAEEGEVQDDESPSNNIVNVKNESITPLILPSLVNIQGATLETKRLNQNTLYATMVRDLQFSKMAETIDKLAKFVVKRKKSKKKSSRKKSKSKRSRSRSSSRSISQSHSRSRSRSSSPKKISGRKSHLKKKYLPKRYQSSSSSQSMSRESSSSPSKRNSRSIDRSRFSSHSMSKSPQRKTNHSRRRRSRSISRSPVLSKTRALKNRKKSPSMSPSPRRKRKYSTSFSSSTDTRSPVLSKTRALKNRKKSPSMSPPPRRKRKYSTSSSSSTDTSSSSSRNERQHSKVSKNRSQSPDISKSSPSARHKRQHSKDSTNRSQSPDISKSSPSARHKRQHSKDSTNRSQSPEISVSIYPSTSQTIVAQKTIKQEYRQGCNVMTREATVTTSYQERLQSFKNQLQKKIDGRNDFKADSFSKINELKVTVFDKAGRDVTFKRPNGDLNHPFYIHPEDAELYQVKCRNGSVTPLQALHEICTKCCWRLPNYILLPTPKGFRFGMEINEHKFVTEKTAPQKKAAKAEAALVVLQWMRVAKQEP